MTKEFNLSDYVFNPNNDNYQAISWIYVKKFIKEILDEIDIPTFKLNEILWEEGFRNEMLGVIEKENITKKEILDITFGFGIAIKIIKRIIKQKAGDKLI